MFLRFIKNLITWLVMGPEQKCRRDCPCNWTTNDDHLWRELHEDYRHNNGESYL
ncbi:MAG: hypothetical protein QOF31_5140 [Mycobacterium sp.]|jgi:hypothetical protein|nr:hypothetical protein [Mycobacterium sp.]